MAIICVIMRVENLSAIQKPVELFPKFNCIIDKNRKNRFFRERFHLMRNLRLTSEKKHLSVFILMQQYLRFSGSRRMTRFSHFELRIWKSKNKFIKTKTVQMIAELEIYRGS